jgi:hypothetical protein
MNFSKITFVTGSFCGDLSFGFLTRNFATVSLTDDSLVFFGNNSPAIRFRYGRTVLR